jgi:ubiquitin carboxyl-terminal hydrolase 8
MTSTASGPAAPNGVGRPQRVLPHISDVLAGATPDVDVYAPIETILQRAETHFREAETAREFGRPDTALSSYLKAYIIVAELMPKHKDIGNIKAAGNPKQQHARYMRLRKQVVDGQDVFDKLKADIKADNVRTGVLPRAQQQQVARPPSSSSAGPAPSSTEQHGFQQHDNRPLSPPINGTTGDMGNPMPSPTVTFGEESAPNMTNGASDVGASDEAAPHESSPPSRAKPPVHAKPASLHGNAIKTKARNGAAPVASAQDLNERFSKLRMQGPAGGSVQSSQALNGAVPYMPGHRPNLSLGRAILPDLPNLPAPVYSPSRGTLSSAVADLPSSTERVSLDRSASAISINGSAALGLRATAQNDYFQIRPASPAQRIERAERKRPEIPEGQTLSVDEMVKYMNAGTGKVKMLVIDVRSREEFDEGHIMAQECICVEGNTLQRIDSSASEILDSMVLSPDVEQDAFIRRHEYDLIVFYDESSTQLKFRRDNARDKALTVLFNALVHFDTPTTRSEHTMKLLRGGIAAWIDKMGERSLTTSAVRAGVAAAAAQRRRPRAKAPKLRQDEIDQWEEKLKSGPPIVRDTEQFFRRGGIG